MKLDKRVKNQVNKMIKGSFDTEGKLVEKKATQYIGELKNLSSPKAIAALSEYLKGIKREMQKSTLEIESAISLVENQIKELAAFFGSLQKINEVKTSVNSSLLGGIRIKMGDMVFDDSVSQKIAQVKGVIHG